MEKERKRYEHKIVVKRRGWDKKQYKIIQDENLIFYLFFEKEKTIDEAFKLYKKIGGERQKSYFYEICCFLEIYGYLDYLGKKTTSKKGSKILRGNIKPFFDYLKDNSIKLTRKKKEFLISLFKHENIRRMILGKSYTFWNELFIKENVLDSLKNIFYIFFIFDIAKGYYKEIMKNKAVLESVDWNLTALADYYQLMNKTLGNDEALFFREQIYMKIIPYYHYLIPPALEDSLKTKILFWEWLDKV